MSRLAFLGCGHMGKDILKGLLKHKRTSPSAPVTSFIATVSKPSSVRNLEGEFKVDKDHVQFLSNNNLHAARQADMVLLSFPPSELHKVLSEPGLNDAVSNKLVISILAGVTRDAIQKRLKSAHIVRVMPSLGARAQQSATLFIEDTPSVPQHLKDQARRIIEVIGPTHDAPAHLFDEMTALAAFSHAMLTVAIDAITDTFAKEGVSREVSVPFAASCLAGYASVLARGDDFTETKQFLTTPLGITNKAIVSLEKNGFKQAIDGGVEVTTQYARLLSKQTSDDEV